MEWWARRVHNGFGCARGLKGRLTAWAPNYNIIVVASTRAGIPPGRDPYGPHRGCTDPGRHPARAGPLRSTVFPSCFLPSSVFCLRVRLPSSPSFVSSFRPSSLVLRSPSFNPGMSGGRVDQAAGGSTRKKEPPAANGTYEKTVDAPRFIHPTHPTLTCQVTVTGCDMSGFTASVDAPARLLFSPNPPYLQGKSGRASRRASWHAF